MAVNVTNMYIKYFAEIHFWNMVYQKITQLLVWLNAKCNFCKYHFILGIKYGRIKNMYLIRNEKNYYSL